MAQDTGKRHGEGKKTGIQLQQEVIDLRKRLELELIEKEQLRRQIGKANEPEPIFFEKFFNKINSVTKAKLINSCRNKLYKLFVLMPDNIKNSRQLDYSLAMDELVTDLEAFILRDSGRRWTIRGNGFVDIMSRNPNKNQPNDKITITFSYPALKKPGLPGLPGMSELDRRAESPTPEPVMARLTCEILFNEVSIS